jgi:hypothetical protein
MRGFAVGKIFGGIEEIAYGIRQHKYRVTERRDICSYVTHKQLTN